MERDGDMARNVGVFEEIVDGAVVRGVDVGRSNSSSSESSMILFRFRCLVCASRFDG